MIQVLDQIIITELQKRFFHSFDHSVNVFGGVGCRSEEKVKPRYGHSVFMKDGIKKAGWKTGFEFFRIPSAFDGFSGELKREDGLGVHQLGFQMLVLEKPVYVFGQSVRLLGQARVNLGMFLQEIFLFVWIGFGGMAK